MTGLKFFFLAAGAALIPACGSSDEPPHDLAGSGGADAGGASSGGASTGGASTGGASTGGASGASGTGGMAAGPSTGGASSSEGPCAPGSTTDFLECPSLDPAAIFVAAGASGPGTRESPMGELSVAIYQAVARGTRRIIVCNATYAESVVVSGDRAGVQLHGGYTCPVAGGAGWVRTPDVRPTVRPLAGPALWVNGVTDTVLIQDVAFESADATQPGESSIAAMVSDAADLQLQGVSIKAGRGANAEKNGADGEDGSDGQLSTAEQNGASAHCRDAGRTGGVALAESCRSRGGSGAQGNRSGVGRDGEPGIPDILGKSFPGNGGKGASAPHVGGQRGVDGRSGAPGAMGEARPLGIFLADRYIPQAGGAGDYGEPGQGGGGGGASAGIETADLACYGAGGGAGGMGGCGGAGGSGGLNGGASVALLSWDSAVTLTSCTLTASPGGSGGDGGNGGNGGNGALGGEGGPGLDLEQIGPGGPGGRGGSGADGGAGAGGSGGPSFAIVFHQREVVRVGATSLRPGPGGAFGKGGVQTGRTLSPVAAPSGANGATAEVYEQK